MDAIAAKKEKYHFLSNGISGSTLKIIALISMSFDHIGVVCLEKMLVIQGAFEINSQAQYDAFIRTNQLLYNTYTIFRFIGRLAFPIFCFLIVQGFIHTHDIKKYLWRILLFAFIAEIPFDLALFNRFFYWEYQNIFFTLFLGIVAMLSIQTARKKSNWNIFFRIIFGFVGAVTCLAAAFLCKSDYGMEGVLVIIIMYLFKERKTLSAGLGCAVLMYFPYFLSLIPIHFYNGERGRNIKWIFYLFYPIHLLILYFLSYFIV